MSTKLKKTKTISKRETFETPVEISRSLKNDWHHIILHKSKSGFAYTVFWQPDQGDPAEPVGTSVKSYKTREECIRAIKKLNDASPKGISTAALCFDYKYQKVDVEIKYDVKKLI